MLRKYPKSSAPAWPWWLHKGFWCCPQGHLHLRVQVSYHHTRWQTKKKQSSLTYDELYEIASQAVIEKQRKGIELSDIELISFHNGYTKIIEIWKKTNSNCNKKLGIVRDYDDEPAAQAEHEKYNDCAAVLVTTTKDYTLEPEIVKTGENYTLLQSTYGNQFGWNGLTPDQLSDKWRTQKADVMLTISRDIANGDLVGLEIPVHIQAIFDFMVGKKDDN